MLYLRHHWKKLSASERRELARLLGLAFVRGGLFSLPATLVACSFAAEDQRLFTACLGVEMSLALIGLGAWLLMWGCTRSE